MATIAMDAWGIPSSDAGRVLIAPIKPVSKTDQLIQSVLAAPDHRLEVDYFKAEEYERRARTAIQFKKLPHGKCLRIEQKWQEHKA